MILKYTGIGTRVLNFFIDTILLALLAILLFRLNNWYVFYYKTTYYNFGWFFFGSSFIYYNILEGIFARTPGKWFSHTKVVNQKGYKPNFISIVIRSLVRLTVIDMFFIPFLNKTLHDYLSKTEVVEA